MNENRFLLPGDPYDDVERIKRLVQERRSYSMANIHPDDYCCSPDDYSSRGVEPEAETQKELPVIKVPDELVMCFPEIALDEPKKGKIVYDLNEDPSSTMSFTNQWHHVMQSFRDKDYFACRLGVHIPIMFIPRSIVEDLPYVKQAVVGIFIQSETRVFLMKCLEGDMAGKYTMLEGHVAIPIEHKHYELIKVNRVPLEKILYENAIRELNEEIHIDCGARVLVDAASIRLTPKWFTHKNEVPCTKDISAKHVGFIYSMWIPDRLLENLSITSNEKCNELISINKDNIDKEFIDKCDTWLQDILERVISL